MADSMESVIAGAISDAGLSEGSGGNDGGNEVDTDVDTSTDSSEGESSEVSAGEGDAGGDEADASGQESGQEAETEAEPVEEPVVEEPAEELSQLDKDLAELGIKAPKPGQRENKLPHSRVRTLIEKHGKKVEARFTQQLDVVTRQARAYANKAQTMDNVDKLIATDPDRYMRLLDTIHPGKFDKYMNNASGRAAADGGKPNKQPQVPQSVADLGPEPQPDVEFEDKSRGYSPQQHAKLMKWTRDVAKAEAKEEAIAEMEARMEAKYGPMAKSFASRQAINAEIPRVRAEVASIHETWGKEFVEKHEHEIVELMKENEGMTAAEATTRVLLPKVRAERNSVRTGVIKDQKARTAAAAKVVPSGTANKEAADEGTIEDVIRRQIATLRR